MLVCVVAAGIGLKAQAPNPPTQFLAGQTFEGILGVVWGDPHPLGSASDVQYTLTLSDGRMLRLQLTGQENEAALHFGKRVLVSGRAAQAQAVRAGVASTPSAVVVDSLALSQAPQADAYEAVALGTKKVIFLLVKFSDDAAVPHPPSFYTDMTNPDTPPAGALFPSTLNGFFKKTYTTSSPGRPTSAAPAASPRRAGGSRFPTRRATMPRAAGTPVAPNCSCSATTRQPWAGRRASTSRSTTTSTSC